jgi:hypothetical protein
MFPSAVTGFVVAPAEVVAVVAGGVAVAVEDCARAAGDEVSAADAAAPADDVGVADERDEAGADGAEADEDWLAEQPTTARPASTAQAVATLTVDRRATPSAGAHGYPADARRQRCCDEEPALRFPSDAAITAQTRAVGGG